MDDFRVAGNNKFGVNFGKLPKLENGWNGGRCKSWTWESGTIW
jgi:hypothetical protein